MVSLLFFFCGVFFGLGAFGGNYFPVGVFLGFRMGVEWLSHFLFWFGWESSGGDWGFGLLKWSGWVAKLGG